MGGKVHMWTTTYTQGLEYEEQLDDHFSKWYQVEPVGRAEQKRGIDRMFTRSDGARFSVEYKGDSVASRTQNAFIETVSVDTAGKPGWAYTSTAQVLAYYCPGLSKVYLVNMVDLKRQLPRWCGACREVSVQNEGYRAKGLLVPLLEFGRLAFEVLDVGVKE